MNTVDIIILSNTKDIRYYNMLKRCLESLKSSSNVLTNTIVVETNKKLKDKQKTLNLPIDHFVVPNDEVFNYNRYQNYGLEHSNSNFICFSNAPSAKKKKSKYSPFLILFGMESSASPNEDP